MATTTTKVLITNIVSIAAVVLSIFGIDVSPEDQATIVGGIAAIASVVTMILVTVRSRKQLLADEVQAASKRQGGYAAPPLLAAVALVTAAALMLGGCVNPPTSPRQALAASYSAVSFAAESAAIAYRDGVIDDAERKHIRAVLTEATDYLEAAEALIIRGVNADDALTRAREALMIVQRILIEARNDG